MAMGGTCRYATGAFRNIYVGGRRQYSHVWWEAFEPRSAQWILLDPVAAERTNKMLRELVAVEYWVI